VILTSGLGVVWKDCREHTSLDVIATRVCRAAAEASISLQLSVAMRKWLWLNCRALAPIP